MKTKKLNLNDLKVESFITNIDEQDAYTVKGGSSPLCAATAGLAISVSIVAASILYGATQAANDGLEGAAK